MLQPRKRKFILKIVPKGLLLCVIILFTFTQNFYFAKGDDESNGLIRDKIRRGERVIRHGDVNIVVLDDFDRRKITPSLGLLSTTARTFIQEGTTTEFATHIYGTTVGDKYAHIVSTGSKIFYDHVRPSKEKTVDPIITIPSLDFLIFSPDENVVLPSKVVRDKPSEKAGLTKRPSGQISAFPEKPITHPREEIFGKNSKSLKADIPSVSEKVPVTLNNPKMTAGTEISMIKPAKVKNRNELPTFTVKQDSTEYETEGNRIYNSEYEIDNIYGLEENEKRPHFAEKTPQLTTTTYFGFADFVTTAGDTVIVFTPQMRKSVIGGSVTSIVGEPTFFHNTVLPSKVTISTISEEASFTPKFLKQNMNDLNEMTGPAVVTNSTTSEMKNEQPRAEMEVIESPESMTEDTTERLNENEFTTEGSNEDSYDTVNPSQIHLENTSLTTPYNKFSNFVDGNETSTLTYFRPAETKFSEAVPESETQSIVTEETGEGTHTNQEGLEKERQNSTEMMTETNETTTTTESSEDNDTDATISTTEMEMENEGAAVIASKMQPLPAKTEEEVELIFKTLYTTYTYLTTYFEKSSTMVKSREEVVTNVITSTLDSAFLQQATDPAVAGLFSKQREAKYLASVRTGRPSMPHHTTPEEDENEILASKIEERFSEQTKPTPALKLHSDHIENSVSAASLSLNISDDFGKTSSLSSQILADTKQLPDFELSNENRKNVLKIFNKSAVSERLPANFYKTTIKRHRMTAKSVEAIENTKTVVADNSNTRQFPSKDSIISEEMTHNSVIISAPLTRAKDGVEQLIRKRYNDSSEDDQLSQESNTEEMQPANSPPLISLQTSYTTYTYFTTIYKGSSSDIVSRLETVTNVNTELIKPTSTRPTFVEDITAPVTYYTTYTYWTTFYKDGSTMIKSRQETISNVVTPTPSLISDVNMEMTKPAFTSSTMLPSSNSTNTSFTEQLTYYTTFTYFTTSYVGNSSVINSHLETITNIIQPSIANTQLLTKADEVAANSSVVEHSTFLSTASLMSAETRLLSDGLSESDKLPNSPRFEESKPTGVISVEKGKIIDAFGISTTLYTTSVIGTYIEQLYAQIIESTSSVVVDTEKRTNLPSLSTVILNDKLYQTGVLRTNLGSIVKADGTTIFYATKILGSIVDGQYSSITETSSSVLVNIAPSKTIDIQPTLTASLSVTDTTITVSTSSISPTSAVIESSMNEYSEKNHLENDDEEEKSERSSGKFENNRHKSFTPVIRPFSSRSRPTFQPKRKTGEPSSAATITRGITPTIVAIPAIKGSESRSFGSANRNRFAGGGKKATSLLSSSSSTAFHYQSISAASSKRYSRTKSNVPYNAISSSPFTRHVLEKSNPTYSSTYPNYNRRGGAYRSSNVKLPYQVSQPSPGSRFRIRPTTTGNRFGSSFSIHGVREGKDKEENDDQGEETRVEDREQRTQQSQDDQDEQIMEQTLSSSDDQVIETLPPVTTESSRKTNPLLRFRKPISPRTSTTTSAATRSTQHKNTAGGTRRNDARSTTVRPVTKTSYSRGGPPPPPHSANSRIRLKPTNSLFATAKTVTKALSKQANNEFLEDAPEEPMNVIAAVAEDETFVDSEQETNISAIVEKEVNSSARTYNPVSIKPFPYRGRRTRRQAEFGYKYESIRAAQKSRYRRPTMQNSFPDYLYYDDVEYTTEDISPRSIGSRNYAKSRNTPPPSYQQQFYQQYSTEDPVVTNLPPVKIRPSSTYSGRTPFTLREKPQSTTPISQRSSHRRTTISSYRKYENGIATTTKRPHRQRTYTTSTTTESALSYRNGRKPSSTRRTSSRSRYKDNDYNSNAFSQANNFDGTITVTYKIPEEVTIPVVSGTVTEYKNVVTAKPSVQLLGPHQYSTVTGKNGLTTLQLVAENSETMLNGVIEVTRYVIQEFPTSSVTFTPTTIRGRKTSFSHVIPSTVYEVKPEVSTIPPQLNANAPLANLLLSQLLLGNLGIQSTLNPLLGLNGAAPGTPLTEYKTKTTSYVTTITHSTSTIIPVTFRGKEIKTTVVDSSTQVITATEYLTDTIVITPANTVPPGTNQLNTLLLPALLHAQLLNQATTQHPTTVVAEDVAENLQLVQEVSPSFKTSKVGQHYDNNAKINDDYALPKKSSKNNKQIDSPPIQPAETSVVTLYLSGRRPGEFSTVLSTVTLDDDKSATLQKRNAPLDWKTDLISTLPKSTAIPHLHFSSRVSVLDDGTSLTENLIKSAINEVVTLSPEVDQETETLESVMENVSDYLSGENKVQATTTTFDDEGSTPLTSTLETLSNHFLLKTSAESAPFQRNFVTALRSENVKRKRAAAHYQLSQSGRYLKKKRPKQTGIADNDAKTTENIIYTSTMSSTFGLRINAHKKKFSKNVAFGSLFRSPNEKADLSNRTVPQFANHSLPEDEGRGRFNLATKVMSNGVEVIVALDKSTLPGSPQLLRVLPTSIRPITLTPSTVTDHMIMMLPHGLQDNPEPFVTKTYLTTYTYLTTFLKEGMTSTSSEEKVISNTITQNVMDSSDTLTSGKPNAHITLSSSPIMATKVFETTYNLGSTVMEGNASQILISQQTISNTITTVDDITQLLEPSEMNYNEIKPMSTKEFFNEEFTSKPTEQLSSTFTEQTIKEENNFLTKPTSPHATANVTKTYFVTYTYYSTLLENGSTVVKSNVATSSDVVTEKYYAPLKRIKLSSNPSWSSSSTLSSFIKTASEPSIPFSIAGLKTFADRPFQIHATKTYLTTFTYFTTLLQDKGAGDKSSPQTVIRSRTKVIQNLVTEILDPSLLNSDYLSALKNSLKTDSIAVTATATLNNGQKLEITAVNEYRPATSSVDRLSSSLEDNHVHHDSITDSYQSPTDQKLIEMTNDEENDIDGLSVYDNRINNSTISASANDANDWNAANANYTFVTTVLHSTTVMKNGATLIPGSQIIKFTDLQGNLSIIPVSDPATKHPNGVQNQNRPDNKIQMNNLLNLGSLGINSLNALKPVINAMAGLWQNNVKSNVKNKNDGKPLKPYAEKDPFEPNTNLKPPNRTPIYIPVGTVQLDNEEAESEDQFLQQYPDVNQRNNPPQQSQHNLAFPFQGQEYRYQAASPVTAAKQPTEEKPLVSGGGIPISPGQVITANTDVIVGTPAVLGPRPPLSPSNPTKNSNDKSDVPIGMLPPPIPQYVPRDRNSPSQFYKFGDLVKVPPKPLSSGFLNNAFPPASSIKRPPKPVNKHNMDQKIPVPLPSEIKFSQLPADAPLSSTKETDNVPAKLLQTNVIEPAKLQNPVLIEHSTLNPLLVDVRPSQVAQVIIPHGGQTALVYSGEPNYHNTKGEIFNDPSPYPEENVNPGFVGLRVYGPVNSDYSEGASKASSSSNTIHLDIPINPFVADGTITESHHFVAVNLDSNPQSSHNIRPLAPDLKLPFIDKYQGYHQRPNYNTAHDNILNSSDERLQNEYNLTAIQALSSLNPVQGHQNPNVTFQKPVFSYPWHSADDEGGREEVVYSISTERNQHRPYIFPQNKPLDTATASVVSDNANSNSQLFHSTMDSADIRNHNNLPTTSSSLIENESYEYHADNFGLHSNDKLTPQMKVKPNSDSNTNGWISDFNANETEDVYYVDIVRDKQKTKENENQQNQHNRYHLQDENSEGGLSHHEIQQNWEILKDRPVKVKANEKNISEKNSSTRNESNIKLDEWTNVQFPPASLDNEINMSEMNEDQFGQRPLQSHFEVDVAADLHKENVSKTTNQHKVIPSHRNPQDDVVIGLSPPPLRQPPRVVPTQKLPAAGAHQKPIYFEPKPSYNRPSVKTRPKPMNPPYPFEKPNPSSVSTLIASPSKLPKPSTIFGKPASNVLYETNPPNFMEEAIKLKPLNTTGKIEPVKKWSVQASISKSPIFGNIVKVHETSSTNEESMRTTTANSKEPDAAAAIQSDIAKIIVVEKPIPERTLVDKTTELISKWNEIGVISSSKNEDPQGYDDDDDDDDDNNNSRNNSRSTPQLNTNRTRSNTAPNSIFGNLFTRPPPANIVIIPTQLSTTQHYSAISVIIDHEEQPSESDSDLSFTYNVMPPREQIASTSTSIFTTMTSTFSKSEGKTKDGGNDDIEDDNYNKNESSGERQRTEEFTGPTRMKTGIKPSKTTVSHSITTAVIPLGSQSPPTYYVTHTKTLSVTTTQTTVVERDGYPSTHTVILTKTHTTTVVDTVTKIETLVQPTSVLSTITTTVPVILSKDLNSPSLNADTSASYSNENRGVSDSGEPLQHSTRTSDTDSIFVVMTDKKQGTAQISPAIPTAPTDSKPAGFEVQVPDEANEISPNDILFSGIYTQHSENECRPECKVTKNEMCQKADNTMRCVCRPGFARMFPDHPCKPTYTYVMRVPLDHQGGDEIRYTDSLADRTSPSHQQLTEAARDGIDRMVMQSNLRDIYHGIVISGFEQAKKSDKAAVVYIVQLSENAEETKLQEEIHKTLRANNYSLGGTDVFAAPDMFHVIRAEDFDECGNNKYHDCSEHAQCFNLRGTYTCSCKEGFTDVSYNALFPGRICSADAIGCESCNYHGTRYYKDDGSPPTCECFQWYAGEFCQVNLKVTLISLITVGLLLTILLVICLVMACGKQKSPEILHAPPKAHVGFRRYRSVTNIPGDKRAIVSVDTSSEGSIERTPPPFIKKRISRNDLQYNHNNQQMVTDGQTIQGSDQRDRSLTVLIPRAKYRPISSQPSSTLLTMSTFEPEQKLLNYPPNGEGGRSPEKKVSHCSGHSRRLSNSTNLSAEHHVRKKISTPRRPSTGALVSAGFEVSATVRRTQELDEAYIEQSRNDLNQPTYNSIRTVERTVSEARSYDETTIQPPMRSLHNIFHSRTHTCDSKYSSSHKTNLDENHTMGERDLGSTYMPKSQLYKPDYRESDGSNFDSL